MKKSIILALGLAGAAFAGEPAAPITVPTPAPACCPLTLELAAGYAFATGDINDGYPSRDVDLYTADITAVYSITDKHSVSLRLGYGFGDEASRLHGITAETDVRTYNIMPGYRYTHTINEKWSTYIGANIGAARVCVRECVDSLGQNRLHADDSDWGFAWSIEVGASYKLTPTWSAFATYGIFGSTADPEPRSNGLSEATDNQNYHGFRLGVSHSF